jgi:hypothetical protein
MPLFCLWYKPLVLPPCGSLAAYFTPTARQGLRCMATRKITLRCSDVKAKLTNSDHAALLGLAQDL